MRRFFGLAAALILSLALTSPAQGQATARDVLARDFSVFVEWFEGRFDNDRQVFFERDLNVAEEARLDAGHPVLLAARFGAKAIGDLGLHHHHGGTDGRELSE
jgi:hypothetical protein